MKRILSVLTLTALTLTSASAQQGMARLTRFEGRPITGVTVNGPFDVTLVHTADHAQNGAVVDIHAELERYLLLEIDSDGVITIGWNRLWPRHDRELSRIISHNRPTLTLSLDVLNEIEINGSGRVTASDGQRFSGRSIRIQTHGSGGVRGLHLNADRLQLSGSGAGAIEVAVTVARQIEASQSGSGHITLTGSVPRVEFERSGSGRIEASNLRAQKAVVDNSGSGSIRLHAEESIEGVLSGSGQIRYKGNPQHVQVEKSGSGSILPF